eukprot:7771658-Heterocapsa_arctica.AAC.1
MCGDTGWRLQCVHLRARSMRWAGTLRHRDTVAAATRTALGWTPQLYSTLCMCHTVTTWQRRFTRSLLHVGSVEPCLVDVGRAEIAEVAEEAG